MNEFYVDQAGSGLSSAYSGHRYQRGRGWFGRVLRGGVLPLLKSVLPYLKKHAIDTGSNIAEDLIEGRNFKESAVRNLREGGKNLARDCLDRLRAMKGSGIRRRRRRPRVKRVVTAPSRRIRRNRRKPCPRRRKRKQIEF